MIQNTNNFINSMKVHYSPEEIFIKQPLNVSNAKCRHCSSTIKDDAYILDMKNFIFLTRYGGLTEEGIFHLNTNFCSLACAKKELEVITGMSIDNFLNLLAQNISILKQLLNNAAFEQRDLSIEEMIAWYKTKNEGCNETNLTADMLFFAEARGYYFVTEDQDDDGTFIRPFFMKLREQDFRQKYENVTEDDMARYREIFEPYVEKNKN